MKLCQIFICMNSTFICLLQVMANVQEFGVFKIISKLPMLMISSNKTRKPIVCDAYRWCKFSLTAVFKDSLVKNRQLINHCSCAVPLIRWWKNLSIVQEYDFDISHSSFMDTQGHSLTININIKIGDKTDSSWILGKVSSLSFPISFVVWRNNYNILTQFGQTYWQLVNHYSKTTNSWPSAQLWGCKYDLT